MRKVIGIGETVFDIIFRDDKPVGAIPGGSTYNSMISVGRSGIPAEFLSETGDDRVGQRIRSFLEENSVSSRGVCIHKGQKSALSLAFLNAKNDAEYVFYKDHAKDRLEFECPDIHTDDVVLFGSFYAINPVVREQVHAFLEHAHDRGAILYYDVNFRASHRYEIDAVMPNIQENLELADIVRGSSEDFAILYPGCGDAEIYREKISPHCGNFLYTQGAGPVFLRGCDGFTKQYAIAPMNTVSTVGAGDSFNAGFACGLIREGITRKQLCEGLTESAWDALLRRSLAYSRNVCASMENYISVDFAMQQTPRIPQE